MEPKQGDIPKQHRCNKGDKTGDDHQPTKKIIHEVSKWLNSVTIAMHRNGGTDAINKYIAFIESKAFTLLCNNPKLTKPRKMIAKPFMKTKPA